MMVINATQHIRLWSPDCAYVRVTFKLCISLILSSIPPELGCAESSQQFEEVLSFQNLNLILPDEGCRDVICHAFLVIFGIVPKVVHNLRKLTMNFHNFITLVNYIEHGTQEPTARMKKVLNCQRILIVVINEWMIVVRQADTYLFAFHSPSYANNVGDGML